MHEDEGTRVYYLAASTALLRQVPGPTSCEPTEMSMETRGMSGTATAAKHPVFSLRAVNGQVKVPDGGDTSDLTLARSFGVRVGRLVPHPACAAAALPPVAADHWRYYAGFLVDYVSWWAAALLPLTTFPRVADDRAWSGPHAGHPFRSLCRGAPRP